MIFKFPRQPCLAQVGEQFAIEALKHILFQFGKVSSIELLVEGEHKESLMGHIDLERPMIRNEDRVH